MVKWILSLGLNDLLQFLGLPAQLLSWSEVLSNLHEESSDLVAS